MKFPLTLEAVKKGEQAQWAIGDALLAECGPPGEQYTRDDSYEKLKEAAEYLLAQGYDYSPQSLSNFRSVSYSFTNSNRKHSVAWGVYRVAGTPEILDAIISGAPKGTRITQPYVEGIRRTQAEHARLEREEENRKAVAAREKAEAEEAAALKRVREAKEADEKEAAQAEAKKASRKAEKAKQKEQETKVAPRKKAGAPKPEEVPLLVAEMTFMANASRSVGLARQAVKDLQTCLDQLSPKGVKALTSAALEASNAWIDAANTIRGIGGSQQPAGHLSVVGE